MPTPYRINVLAGAARNLSQIFDYINSQSPQNAAKVIRDIYADIDGLEQLPDRFRIYQSSREPRRVVHAMTVAPFIVYCRIKETEHIVEVMTVVHGARRQPRCFP